jgi:glycosyltransferase involved in cell wall biosynthesis
MKVCLVSAGIPCSSRDTSGEISTIIFHLALFLSKNAHDVTLLNVGETHLAPLDRWSNEFAVAGVNVVNLPETALHVVPYWMKKPFEIYEYFKTADCDLVMFPDWNALGHACVIAKRCGLGFKDTALAIIAFLNTPWLMHACHTFPSKLESLAISHMERQAIEYADAVVSPSRYFVEWMQTSGWHCPNIEIIPFFLDGPGLLSDQLPHASARRRVIKPHHLALLAPFVSGEGINSFLKALASQELRDLEFDLTILDWSATAAVETIRNYIASNRPDLLNRMIIRCDLSPDDARVFLSEADCITVIPLLLENSPPFIYEALKIGLPFLTSSSGGVPELIHPDDRASCLFSPDFKSLAVKLKIVLQSEFLDAPRATFDSAQTAATWLRWVENIGKGAQHRWKGQRLAGDISDDPKVTVIITHFERPNLLELNLQALCRQTDRNFEVIVVDDGSTGETAVEFLRRLEQGYDWLLLRIVRQENKFPGAARNIGIQYANTPYVIFLDDDDIAFPNFIETYRRAATFSGADVITSQLQLFSDEFGEPNEKELLFGERWAFSAGPVALGVVANCFGGVSAIFKKELFSAIGYFHEIYGVGYEDWDIYLRAAMANRIILSLPVPLLWYRFRPGSITTATDQYENVRVIASTVQRRVGSEFSQLIDFVIGSQQHISAMETAFREAEAAFHLEEERLHTEQAARASERDGIFREAEAAFHAEEARLRTELANAQHRIEADSHAFRVAEAALRAEEARLRDVLAEKNAQIDVILQSFSWRTTRPLRFLSTIVKRFTA